MYDSDEFMKCDQSDGTTTETTEYDSNEPVLENVHSHYRVLEEIGKGAFSKVYRACQRQTLEIVALKKLRHSSENWIKEVEMLSRLYHPYIIEFIDVMFSPISGSIFIVMEYAEFSLSRIFTATKFSKEQTRYLMKQLLLAVKYLHDMNIIHRDLKEGNLLLCGDGVLKVADFGQSIEAKSFFVKRSRSEVFGTLYYKGIEIMLGKFLTSILCADFLNIICSRCILKTYQKLKEMNRWHGFTMIIITLIILAGLNMLG